jgi:hypothetical protein
MALVSSAPRPKAEQQLRRSEPLDPKLVLGHSDFTPQSCRSSNEALRVAFPEKVDRLIASLGAQHPGEGNCGETTTSTLAVEPLDLPLERCKGP